MTADKEKVERGQPSEEKESNPITSPKEVEESNDAKVDQDFPGYPHYPAKEDILDPENNNGKVDVDVDNLTRSNKIDSNHLKEIKGVAPVEGLTADVIPEEEDELGIIPGTDADVTAEDLALLGPRDEDMDMGEDEELRAKGYKPRTGIDLDIPGAELDDTTVDAMGEGDEENSYYSLGGDGKDD